MGLKRNESQKQDVDCRLQAQEQVRENPVAGERTDHQPTNEFYHSEILGGVEKSRPRIEFLPSGEAMDLRRQYCFLIYLGVKTVGVTSLIAA